jgi:hypothetical protein
VAGMVDEPAHDCVEAFRNGWMEPQAVPHALREACSCARAAAKASSPST